MENKRLVAGLVKKIACIQFVFFMENLIDCYSLDFLSSSFCENIDFVLFFFFFFFLEKVNKYESTYVTHTIFLPEQLFQLI